MPNPSLDLSILPGYYARAPAHFQTPAPAIGMSHRTSTAPPPHVLPNFQSYAVQLDPHGPIGRDALMQHLLDRGIATRRGVMLAHRERPYRAPARHLPVSEHASDHSMLLPLFPGLSEQDQDRVLTALFELA